MGVEYAPKVHNQSGDYVARRVKRRGQGWGGRENNIIYCGGYVRVVPSGKKGSFLKKKQLEGWVGGLFNARKFTGAPK